MLTTTNTQTHLQTLTHWWERMWVAETAAATNYHWCTTYENKMYKIIKH